MNAKEIFLGLLSVTVALTPLASLKSASALEQFNNQTAKANLIARGGGSAAGAGELGISAAQLEIEINNLVVGSRNREGFVKGMMEKATFAAGSGVK